VTVSKLIDLLKKLPPDTQVFQCFRKKIYSVETGDYFPLKVLETKDKCALYLDDGLGYQDLKDSWDDLDLWIKNTFPPPSELQ
jgi:hypothetical protein